MVVNTYIYIYIFIDKCKSIYCHNMFELIESESPVVGGSKVWHASYEYKFISIVYLLKYAVTRLSGRNQKAYDNLYRIYL